ncbi:MAG: tetraacyldisaccharide 4'-kinase [Zoogloeaceae bacterium]|nr:tetraacyldisaccharide 4'-kinase [Zoogloeaceae bacterium]
MAMGLRQWIVAGWEKRGVRAVLLLPLALPFALAVKLRQWAYRHGWASAVKLPVPVLVVGNITVGGSGKTPLTLHLARELAQRGWRPGIVSRGYGGTAAGVEAVSATSDPAHVGDEPLLLARRAGCPVFIGRDRVAAARALLAAHPDRTVLIADDGLQHLRLARDIEIVVMDERGIGNGWPLPAGPLRECPRRIAAAHALVLNGNAAVPAQAQTQAQTQTQTQAQVFRMRLAGDYFYNLRDPQHMCGPDDLRGQRLHALAGIGAPERFFRQLENMGLQARTHAFPDHHRFQPADLAFPDADALLMTEKDAVKCQPFAPSQAWVLPVDAQLDPDLARWVVEKLDGCASA